jgi:nitric oxide-associated protein 1
MVNFAFKTFLTFISFQILHLLTTDEIIKTIPKEMMRARAFLLKKGLTLFLAGLGRLDYIDGPESTRVVVFSSLELPVTICSTEDADEFYEAFLGSEVFGVPMDSGEERLSKWPKLEPGHDKIVIEGIEKHITVCDILLSSAGWVGINIPKGLTGTFRAWTPEKRGIYVRNPSLLPYGMTLRGKRVRRSYAYLIGDAFTFRRPKK